VPDYLRCLGYRMVSLQDRANRSAPLSDSGLRSSLGARHSSLFMTMPAKGGMAAKVPREADRWLGWPTTQAACGGEDCQNPLQGFFPA